MARTQVLLQVMVSMMMIPGLDAQIPYVNPICDLIGASCICLAQGFSKLSVGAGPLWVPGSHTSKTVIFPIANNSAEKLLT